MRDRYGGDDDRYGRFLVEASEIVDEEVQRLRALVREFSEFARLPEPKPEEGDFGVLLDELARLYGADRVVVHRPPPDRPGLTGRFDAEEMKRVLINLIDNGLAACATAGRPESVEIRAAVEENGGLRIDVADGGAGIAPDVIDRIFEPDFTTKREGMGLGLAIVDGIVSAHGGTIDVRSERGVGSNFIIRLPATGRRPANHGETERGRP